MSTTVTISEARLEDLRVDREETPEVQVWIIRVKMATSMKTLMLLNVYRGLRQVENQDLKEVL